MEEQAVVIRLATPADARDIERVLRRGYAQYRGRIQPPLQALNTTWVQIARDIRTPGRGYLVAELEEDGTIVGASRFRQIRVKGVRVWEGSNLAVDPDYRSRGIGKRLVEASEELAREAGILHTRGYVRVSMAGLLDFYKGMGHRVLGYLSKPGYPRYAMITGKRLHP